MYYLYIKFFMKIIIYHNHTFVTKENAFQRNSLLKKKIFRRNN